MNNLNTLDATIESLMEFLAELPNYLKRATGICLHCTYEIFTDYSEGYNIAVIFHYKDYSSDEILDLENKLFELPELKNASAFLKHVTISFVGEK